MLKDRQNLPAFPIVGVGASAGGLEAFEELLRRLPIDTGMGFVFVQHLAPGHPSLLVELLLQSASMPVCEARDGDPVKPDHVYVIPPHARLTISRGVLHVASREKRNAVPLPVDAFFSSLAGDRRRRAIGVILSGNASDGTEGLKAIKAAGGVTFAQDERTAKFPGMPRSAVASGAVDFVLTPDGIAKKLVEIAHRPPAAPRPAEPRPFPREPAARDGLPAVFSIVKRVTGADFSLYKRSTVLRRVQKRLKFHGMTSLPPYVRLLQRSPKEAQALMEEILIHATSFFRDPSVFENLKRHVFPKILRNKNLRKPCRVWVPGCSTGEEAYSIAMGLVEAWERKTRVPVKIFATDVSDLAIQAARRGVFKKNKVSGVSRERLRRFFTKTGDDYEIAKEVRELCIFGKHDLIREPSLSNLDLISCRNLFIYFEPLLQRRLFSVLYYALRPNGRLLLGKAETLVPFPHLFRPVHKRFKIYAKAPPNALREEGTRALEEENEELNATREAALMAHEELRATNMELQGSNEELQSANEELETAQEELQSTNEELTTLSEELQARNDELSQAREFADGIVETIREPLLILDGALRVVRANLAFYAAFGLTPQETEKRPLFRLLNGQWDIPRLRELLGEIIPRKKEVSNFEIEHDFPGIGYRTLLLNARQVRRKEPEAPMILVAIDLLTMENRVAKKIVEFSEDEKQRIGKDLHDGLGQRMTGIALLSRSLEKRLADKEGQDAAKITQLVKQGIVEIRRLARGLSPLALEKVGLVPALAEAAEQAKDLFGVDCVFECGNEKIDADPKCNVGLYYIAQEAINNAVKHGKAERIRVRLERQKAEDGEELVLSVKDNGVGLPKNFEGAERGKGSGLRIMQYRASVLGARVDVRRGAKRGTVVTVRCPY